jgi:pentatricopeptide repeat protein
MPRARIPNASLIASAEFPVLPFLAPRVFAESCALRKSYQQNGKQARLFKEEVNSERDNVGVNAVAVKATITAWGALTCASLRCKNGHPVGGLLQSAHSRWRPSSGRFPAASIESRYAEIAAFTHQSTRGYRTSRAGARRNTSPKKAVPARGTEVPVSRNPSVLQQRGSRLASKREEALVVERARLANFVVHELDTDISSLMKHGQYRSLRRRITNLERWNETQLNLHERRGWVKQRFALMRSFAALDRTMYPGIGRHTRKIYIRHDPRCVRWSAGLFRNIKEQDISKQGLQQVWDKWMGFDTKLRQSIYQRLLVYLLDRKPARAIQFIQVIASDHLLRGLKREAIADALGHLSKIHKSGTYSAKQGWNADKTAIKKNFVSAFVHVYLQTLTMHRKICSQDLLYNLANIASTKDLKKVFEALIENRAVLGFDTFLHYANTFAEAGQIRFALRCLDELKASSTTVGWDTVSDRERLRWTCALILRKSMSKEKQYHETPRIVAAFVGLGIKMDLLLYNVVMHNAMEALDYATAFKVYNALEGNGLKADKHTYSILLHGCTLQTNPAMFKQFAEHSADVAQAIKDPWLATDYLYYLYIRHQNDSDKAQTAALLRQAYVRFFPVTPLDLLRSRLGGVVRVTSGSQLMSMDDSKIDPPPVALYIMLQAQIQEALAISMQRLTDLYERFKSLVRHESDPALTRLAKEPVAWNAFLLAFCQKQQFASASQLIRDMTDNSPQPNIYSWNIFMQAFFKTGQVQAAERVFEILRTRGVDPDQFSYGVLLRGYAKAQHVERIGETMQHVDAEQEMEPDLLRALAQIANRKTLMSTLEKSRVRKEVQAQEKARVEAEEETRRWTAPRLADKVLGEAASSISAPVVEQDLDSIPGAGADALDEESIRLMNPAITSTAKPRSAATSESRSKPESAIRPQPATTRPATRPHNPATSTPPSIPDEATTENPLDPDIQYLKLQQHLGLLPSHHPPSPNPRSVSQSLDDQTLPVRKVQASRRDDT